MSKRQIIDEGVVQKGGVNEPPRLPRPSTPPPAQRPAQTQPAITQRPAPTQIQPPSSQGEPKRE